MAEDYEVHDDEPLSAAEVEAMMIEAAIARARLVNEAAALRLTPSQMFSQGRVVGRQRTDTQMRSELAPPAKGDRAQIWAGAQAIAALEDAGLALRAGDDAEALRILFIWQQRRVDILAGIETWRQNYSGTKHRHDARRSHQRGHFARPVVDIALHEAFAEGAGLAKAPDVSAVPDDDEIVDAEVIDE